MIIIIGHRWNRPGRSGGGVYHKVRLWSMDGVHDKEFLGFREGYGSGDAYLQTAREFLIDSGHFPKTGRRLTSGMDEDLYVARCTMQDHPKRYFYSVCDVPRERDL